MPDYQFNTGMYEALRQSPAGDLIAAAHAGAEINLRRGQLERQLEAMAVRQQQTDFLNSIREQEFQRKLDQGDQRIELMRQGLAIRDTYDSTREMLMTDAANKKQAKADDIAAGYKATTEAGSAAYDPMNPDYVSTRLGILRDHPFLPWKTEDIIKEANAARKVATTNLAKRQESLIKMAGFPATPENRDVLLNPEHHGFQGYRTLPTEEERKRGIKEGDPSLPVLPSVDPEAPEKGTIKHGRTIKDSQGIPRQLEVKDNQYQPADSRVYYSPRTNTSAAYFTTIPNKKLRDLSAQMRALEDEGMKIPPQLSSITDEGTPRKLIRTQEDYNQLTPGQTYLWYDDNGKPLKGTKQ
jgi:hypothetical protein